MKIKKEKFTSYSISRRSYLMILRLTPSWLPFDFELSRMSLFGDVQCTKSTVIVYNHEHTHISCVRCSVFAVPVSISFIFVNLSQALHRRVFVLRMRSAFRCAVLKIDFSRIPNSHEI